MKVNYRSQAKIIELSNVIINILEVLFPTSLDKIKKERPFQKGKKSIFMSNQDILRKLLKKLDQNFNIQEENKAEENKAEENKADENKVEENKAPENANEAPKNDPNLGLSYVVLVRNNQIKKNVESWFAQFHCPVFTIFESKVKNLISLSFLKNSCFFRDWNSKI